MYFLYKVFTKTKRWSFCAKSAADGGNTKTTPDKQIA
jgi:hypothetical protein